MSDEQIAWLDRRVSEGDRFAWIGDGFHEIKRVGMRREAYETADQSEMAATFTDGSYVALHGLDPLEIVQFIALPDL